jgi:hypothetical protein
VGFFVKTIGGILSFVAFLAAYNAAGLIWGVKGKVYFLVGFVLLVALLALIAFILSRKARRDVAYMEPDVRAAFLEKHPDYEEALKPPYLLPPAWGWQLLDGICAIMSLIGAMVFVSKLQHQPIRWSEGFHVTGYHLLSIAAGGGVYYLVRMLAIRWWRRKHGDSTKPAA